MLYEEGSIQHSAFSSAKTNTQRKTKWVVYPDSGIAGIELETGLRATNRIFESPPPCTSASVRSPQRFSEVGMGFLTSPSPFQLAAFDRPNLPISVFPLALIPVFAVPVSILLHLASLQRLRESEKSRNMDAGLLAKAVRAWVTRDSGASSLVPFGVNIYWVLSFCLLGGN
jgi:hypothetical protein